MRQARLLLLSTAAVLGLAASLEAPLPPSQTAAQREAMVRLSAAAAESSQAATPKLLALLESDAFRANLSVFAPALAKVPAPELLRRWRAELEVAEIAHGFHAANNPLQNNALDIDIDMASNATWFYNQWQLPVLFPLREEASFYELVSYLAPAAATEVQLYGLNSFTADIPWKGVQWPGGWPASLAEASDRAVYGILNQHKTDFPTFYWGDVAVVFNYSAVRDAVIYNPMDSGDFTCDCNTKFATSFCATWPNKANCSAFWYCAWDEKAGHCKGRDAAHPPTKCASWAPRTVGTAGAADHTLLSYGAWEEPALGPAQRLAGLLARMLQSWRTPGYTNMTTQGAFDYYFEANILGNPRFPHGVKFVIADFSANFGTAAGGKVRTLCAKWGWPLVWALGTNMPRKVPAAPTPSPGGHPDSWRSTSRVLDPQALLTSRAAGNISSAAQGALPSFARTWQTVAQARGGKATVSAAQFQVWWGQLSIAAGRQLNVEPLRAHACAAAHSCMGHDSEGHCVCYDT